MNINFRLSLTAIFICHLLFGISQLESLERSIKKSGSYLPDFSYAGYHGGEKSVPTTFSGTVIKAEEYGVLPNDGLDDSKALVSLLEGIDTVKGPVKLILPKGRIILSDILYFQRNHLTISGLGSDENGTEIYIPRPMMYLDPPEDLKELREYLEVQNKIQKEKKNNIHLPFSPYSWTGGMLWTRVPGVRVKSYLNKYDKEEVSLAQISKAKRATKILEVSSSEQLKVGDVVEIQWFNRKGKSGKLLKELYGDFKLKVGSHHWNFPKLPLVRQQVRIMKITGNKVTIDCPLLISIQPGYDVVIKKWEHLEEVNFEHFRISFPLSNRIAHHVEQGYNGMYLTRLYNSYVNDVKIHNADSGILTEGIANVTIQNIETSGEKMAHYTVQMGGVHHVLVKNLKVKNKAMHPVSFNTFATQNVYTQCEVMQKPVLDQHSGVNHQNLFDNITAHVSLSNNKDQYPLFAGGGAPYWKPSHGSFSSFWNIELKFSGIENQKAIKLNGMYDGPQAIVIGVHGNLPVSVDYKPNAYVDKVNEIMNETPSLYQYQLDRRLNLKH